MIGLSYEQIIEKIKQEKNIEEAIIKEKIDEKLKQLDGLISLDGAAHIIAHEYNVKIYENVRKRLKINEVVAGITSVDIIGKVVNVYDVREFNKRGSTPSNSVTGKVGSFMMGDETGLIRVAMWDSNLIQHIESGALRNGRIIEVKNSYVKENNGFKELHLGGKASIVFDVADDIEVKQRIGDTREFKTKRINEVNAGENVALNGYVVQVFNIRYYDSCDKCNKKVFENKCEEHGNTTARKIPILNFYLDDGSGNIRIVAFRDNVDKLMPGVNEGNFDKMKNDFVGKRVVLRGKIVKNEMFGNFELMMNNVDEVDENRLVEEAVSA